MKCGQASEPIRSLGSDSQLNNKDYRLNFDHFNYIKSINRDVRRTRKIAFLR